MKEIKAPECYEHKSGERVLFIAGGISNCGDWQSGISKSLNDVDIVLLNPRRDDFDLTNPTMEEEQIKWEHQHLLKADAYLFWFCAETLCPITLFELGKVAGLFPKKPIFVGTHIDYKRSRDIGHQMRLMRPEIKIVHYLDLLLNQVREWSQHPFGISS